MAEELRRYDYFSKPGGVSVPGIVYYPWSDWFNGNPWKIHRGEDFDGSIATFRGAVYAAANRRKMNIKTHIINPDTIVIQASPRKDETNEEN